VLNSPLHRALEDRLVVVVHTEDEATVDHDAEVVQTSGHRRVVAAQVLTLIALDQIARRQRLEADEQTTQPRVGRPLDDIAAKDRINGRGALEQPAHAAHAVEQRRGKTAIAEQMVVKEVQMAPRQPLDLGQRIFDALGVERSPAGKEAVLVAKVAMLRAPARDDDGVGDEIGVTADQVASHRRQPVECAARRRDVPCERSAGAEVL
jgi:hypothetical protein